MLIKCLHEHMTIRQEFLEIDLLGNAR